VKYVDAGYAIALSALALYAVLLVVRRRRLERAVITASPDPGVPRVVEVSAGPEALGAAGAEQPAPAPRPGGEPR